MNFQRAARTDKGVSALGQVVSLQISYSIQDFHSELCEEFQVESFAKRLSEFLLKECRFSYRRNDIIVNDIIWNIVLFYLK